MGFLIILGGLLLIGLIVWLVLLAYLRYAVEKLYALLFGLSWHTYEECLSLNMGKWTTDVVLEAYHRCKYLEIRLGDQTAESPARYIQMKNILNSQGISFEDDETPEAKRLVLQLFEAEGFNRNTAHLYEYRVLVRKGGGRRKPWRLFSLPNIFVPAPAPA